MRRSLIGLMVAAATALVPLLTLAGNQEVAEQVAKALRSSGQLHDYKIGVKYQDGTAWLKGQVNSEEQAKAALAVASQVPGVTKVKSELAVAAATPAIAEPNAGSRFQFGAGAPTSRLQAAGGAFAPEQIARVGSTVPSGSWATGSLDASSMQRLQDAQQAPLAQPVATSFTQAPARQVMATESEPAPARTMRPVPVARMQPTPVAQEAAAPPSYPMMAMTGAPMAMAGAPMAMAGAPMAMASAAMPHHGGAPYAAGIAPARTDQPNMPCYAWPSYAASPNYAAVTYPRQYSPTAWPYIGPFYPYPQVPLGWRKVTLEWDDGWWMLDFKDK